MLPSIAMLPLMSSSTATRSGASLSKTVRMGRPNPLSTSRKSGQARPRTMRPRGSRTETCTVTMSTPELNTGAASRVTEAIVRCPAHAGADSSKRPSIDSFTPDMCAIGSVDLTKPRP